MGRTATLQRGIFLYCERCGWRDYQHEDFDPREHEAGCWGREGDDCDCRDSDAG